MIRTADNSCSRNAEKRVNIVCLLDCWRQLT